MQKAAQVQAYLNRMDRAHEGMSFANFTIEGSRFEQEIAPRFSALNRLAQDLGIPLEFTYVTDFPAAFTASGNPHKINVNDGAEYRATFAEKFSKHTASAEFLVSAINSLGFREIASTVWDAVIGQGTSRDIVKIMVFGGSAISHSQKIEMPPQEAEHKNRLLAPPRSL